MVGYCSIFPLPLSRMSKKYVSDASPLMVCYRDNLTLDASEVLKCDVRNFDIEPGHLKTLRAIASFVRLR